MLSCSGSCRTSAFETSLPDPAVVGSAIDGAGAKGALSQPA